MYESTSPNPAKLIAATIALAAVIALAALAWSALGSGTALAASGSQRECEAAGGTYVKSGPNAICEFPEEQVANENANPNNNSQSTEETTTGHGNIGNDPVTTCTGPPGQCK
jgi:hypothetical protein